MKKDDKQIIFLLPKYFRNETDEGEIKKIVSWIKESEENLLIFDEIRDVWFALSSEENRGRFDTEKAWKIYSRWIDEHAKPAKTKNYNYKLISGMLKYAAVIAVTLVLSFLFLNRPDNEEVFKPFIAEVPAGQTSIITLYDGSVVKLNSGSRLVCNSYNSKTERRVSLNGEGYFKVMHDPDVPFYVDVKKMTIKVYGTEFNVIAYESDNYSETTLVKGKVGVFLPNGKEYLLKPNEMLRLDEKGNLMKKKVDALDYISWLNGNYTFKDAKLSDIAKHIERMFGVKVIIDSPELKEERYAGKINSGDQIYDVMQKLRMTSTFTMGYELKGDTIWIFKN